MAFCGNCGTQTQDSTVFCPGCGTGMAQAPVSAPVAPEIDEARDAEENKFMGVLAYFGLLALIPFFTKKDSPFAQFHAKQGITLCVLWVGYLIVNWLLGLIRTTRTEYVFGIPVEYTSKPWFVTLLTTLLAFGVSVLAIIGIINAVKGLKKPLPLIGGINIIK